jgi:hypothetical protein
VTTLAAASANSNAEPGTLAFIIVFGMAVALVFLFRSMSKQLRKVNRTASQDMQEPGGAGEPARAGKLPDDS